MLLSLPLPLLLEPRRGELESRSDDEPRIPSSELELSELERSEMEGSEIERSELELPLRPPVLPLLDEPERPDELPELPGAFIPPCPPVLLDDPRDDPPLFCDAPMPPWPLLPVELPVLPLVPLLALDEPLLPTLLLDPAEPLLPLVPPEPA